MSLSTSMTLPTLLLIGVLAIPVLVGPLNKDPQRRRDAHRVLANWSASCADKNELVRYCGRSLPAPHVK